MTPGSLDTHPKRTWGETLRACVRRPVLIMLVLGIAAGLPLLLIFGTLSVWLREAGVERATIGFFSWAALVMASRCSGRR